MGAKQSKQNSDISTRTTTTQRRRILRGRQRGGGGGGGGERESSSSSSSSACSSDYMLATRTLQASKIVDPLCSDQVYDLSFWIRGASAPLGLTQTIEATPGLIDGALTATQILAPTTTSSSLDGLTSSSPPSSLLLTASTPIKSPLSGSERNSYESHVWQSWLNVVFILFESNRSGYLGSDDIEAFIHVYGLNDDVVAALNIDATNGNSSRITKKEFEDWLRSNDIDITALRYPFKFLRLVSYCFQNNYFPSPPAMSSYMRAIFRRTFGKTVELYNGMFGHIGIVKVLRLSSSGDRSLPIKEGLLETLLRIWGLTPTQAQATSEQTAKHLGEIGLLRLYRMFMVFMGSQAFDVEEPREPLVLMGLIDRDNDGFISTSEVRSFAAKFNHELSDEAIDRVIRSFDLDGDGRFGREDFVRAMGPLLEGTTWEVWMVGIAFAILLVANPTIILH